jgi:hypothetical protein
VQEIHSWLRSVFQVVDRRPLDCSSFHSIPAHVHGRVQRPYADKYGALSSLYVLYLYNQSKGAHILLYVLCANCDFKAKREYTPNFKKKKKTFTLLASWLKYVQSAGNLQIN